MDQYGSLDYYSCWYCFIRTEITVDVSVSMGPPQINLGFCELSGKPLRDTRNISTKNKTKIVREAVDLGYHQFSFCFYLLARSLRGDTRLGSRFSIQAQIVSLLFGTFPKWWLLPIGLFNMHRWVRNTWPFTCTNMPIGGNWDVQKGSKCICVGKNWSSTVFLPTGSLRIQRYGNIEKQISRSMFDLYFFALNDYYYY